MTAIVCVEDRGGILFLKRRVSRDREVYRDIAENYIKVYMTSYSLPLFDGVKINTGVRLLPISEGERGEVCFVESGEIADNIHKISRLVIYRWNRTYPSDVKLGFEPEEMGFKRVSTAELVGYSHEKITKDIYEKI